MVAAPLPLSLMPGPPATESRWPPAITMRSPLPPGVSAITFSARAPRESASTVTLTGLPSPASPSARTETSTTGISIPGTASVPLGTPRRMRTGSTTRSASAPACSAPAAFRRKKHPLRSTSGI